MKNNFKKIFNKFNNQEGIMSIIIVISFVIIIFKQVFSTYISSLITLIPSILIPIMFVILFLKKKIVFKNYDIFFALMLLIGTISGIVHNQSILAIAYQIKSLSVYYILFIILRNVKFHKSTYKQIIKCINVVTIAIIVLSIIEVIFQKQFLFPESWASQIIYADNYIRAYSLIFNPNIYAFYLLFILTINIKINGISMSIKNILFNSLIITGIILSVSRSAMLCLFLIGLVYIFYLLKSNNKEKIKIINTVKPIVMTITIVIFSMLAIFSANSLYKNSSDNKDNISSHYGNNSSVSSSEDNNSNEENNHISGDTFIDRIIAMTKLSFLKASLSNGRLAVVKVGIQIWEKNILIGTGFSSFLTSSSFISPNQNLLKLGLEYSDNQYMAILVETGLLGMISCIIFVILLLRDFIKNKKNMSIILTIIFLFFGLFVNVLEVQLIAFIYFLLISFDKNLDIIK